MNIYSHIASLFHYPDAPVKRSLAFLDEFLAVNMPLKRAAFDHVLSHFGEKPVTEQQEYYIRTFDVNATCYLDIGYVIFGEDTKRGQMLIEMNKEQKLAGNDCGTEFSDHLPNVLTLLDKTEDAVFRDELATELLMPAIRLMLENFRSDDNIYKQLLVLLQDILQEKYPDVSYDLLAQRSFKNTCYENHGCISKKTSLKN